jgi:predicted ABC-type sugar transport system permease subunit
VILDQSGVLHRGQTTWVPVITRIVLAAIGLIAIAVAINRFRAAIGSAEEAARVGTIPKSLRSVFMYRMGALMTGVVGAAFIAVALLAP